MRLEEELNKVNLIVTNFNENELTLEEKMDSKKFDITNSLQNIRAMDLTTKMKILRRELVIKKKDRIHKMEILEEENLRLKQEEKERKLLEKLKEREEKLLKINNKKMKKQNEKLFETLKLLENKLDPSFYDDKNIKRWGINHEEIKEHSKKYDKIFDLNKKKFKNNFQTDFPDNKFYCPKIKKKIIGEMKYNREGVQEDLISKRNLLEKRLKYGKLVNNFFIPEYVQVNLSFLKLF